VLAAELGDRNAGFAFLEHCHDLAFCKPALLQGSLHIREAPKFYWLTSTQRGSLRYTHEKIDISDLDRNELVFREFEPDVVVNLAAQAGVRYSIENPFAYVQSNLVGFANIIELSKKYSVSNFVYASSSSVYGANEKMPFSEHHNTNHPLSLYAATKKSNELIAHSYSHLFDLPTTGLRFFTVYGPWGRPDMALYKFAMSIIKEEQINIYNRGNHRRDFTYIGDIVEGVISVIDCPAKKVLAGMDLTQIQAQVELHGKFIISEIVNL